MSVQRGFVWVMLACIVASCSVPTVSPTLVVQTVRVAETETRVPALEATELPINPISTPVEYPTDTPTPEISVENLPPLNEVEPSDEEIDAYLESNLGFGLPESDELGWPFGNKGGIFRKDVNGDLLPDIVVDGVTYLIILLRREKSFAPAYLYEIPYRGSCCDNLIVSITDWTGDNIPEVVFDENVNGGGGGYWYSQIGRTIVHCNENCVSVWGGSWSDSIDDNICGGEAYSTSDMQLAPGPDNTPILSDLSRGYSFYVCFDSDEPADHTRLLINQSKLIKFAWDGTQFVKISEVIVSLPQAIYDEAVYEASNQDGVTAAIEAQHILTGDNQNDACRLQVQGRVVGDWFGCKQDFVKISWQDITGDGTPEIVARALSADYGYAPGANGYAGDLLVDEPCFHRRLLAFQWDGQQATEIANVIGCLSIDDLDAVHLNDFDNDGALDIVAAGQGKQIIYKWNGTRFVLWAEVPGE